MYVNIDERYGNRVAATLEDYSEVNPRGIFIEFDDGIYEKPHTGSVWVKVAEAVEPEELIELQMPKNYALVLRRGHHQLQLALRFGRLAKDETYSVAIRGVFNKRRNSAAYRARSLFAVAKRQRLNG